MEKTLDSADYSHIRDLIAVTRGRPNWSNIAAWLKAKGYPTNRAQDARELFFAFEEAAKQRQRS